MTELAAYAPYRDALPAPAAVSARPRVGGYVATGLLVIVLMFGGFGSWAALAPLTSAAMAPGSVKVDSHRKTIQHLEGGIVSEILMRDGDRVTQGQVLLRLDGLDANVDRNAVQGQLYSLVAQEARLVAQRDGRQFVVFPPTLELLRGDGAVAEILRGQERIFADQLGGLSSQVAIWENRRQQFRGQIEALQQESGALHEQSALFEEELGTQRSLLAKGLTRRSVVLELERQVSALNRDRARNDGQVAQLNDQISEAALQIDALLKKQALDVSEELRQVQIKRAQLEEQIQKATAVVGRKDVVAPQSGVILNSRVFAIGAIVPPGGAVLDIVPSEDRLVIEARIQPIDIDVVHLGLPATVRLVAYKARTTPTINGTVVKVSADALTDERSGQVYFLAEIDLDDAELARLPEVNLHPGMPVDVAIVTGEQTLLDYVVQPLMDSFAHAFRED